VAAEGPRTDLDRLDVFRIEVVEPEGAWPPVPMESELVPRSV
jgi:hypothetical protein